MAARLCCPGVTDPGAASLDRDTQCPRIEVASVRKLPRRYCGSERMSARACVCVCVCVRTCCFFLAGPLDFSCIYITDLFIKKM